MQTGPRPGGTPSTWEPDYRQLIESAGDAIYTLDLDGSFTFVNAALLRTLGHAAGALDGPRPAGPPPDGG
jgi:PAS domain S-box-containing protein